MPAMVAHSAAGGSDRGLWGLRPMTAMRRHVFDAEAMLQRLDVVTQGDVRISSSIDQADIVALLHAVREVFMDQPNLLELEAPLKICGDVHGQYDDLLRMFTTCGWPQTTNYLCLGDYVDRGRCGLETICLLLTFKLLRPHNFFLLRGNHECAGINRVYGFYDECKRQYSTKLWKLFTDVFNTLPVAAVIHERIFACHGGLSPEFKHFRQIAALARPAEIRDSGLACDLLWADPAHDIQGWGANDRGVSHSFGEDIVYDFLEKHDLDLIVRAHQVVEAGFQFFADRKLVTLFTAPNYCNEFNNAGGVMSIDEEMTCSFQVIEPRVKCPGRSYPQTSKRGLGATVDSSAAAVVANDPRRERTPPPQASVTAFTRRWLMERDDNINVDTAHAKVKKSALPALARAAPVGPTVGPQPLHPSPPPPRRKAR